MLAWAQIRDRSVPSISKYSIFVGNVTLWSTKGLKPRGLIVGRRLKQVNALELAATLDHAS